MSRRASWLRRIVLRAVPVIATASLLGIAPSVTSCVGSDPGPTTQPPTGDAASDVAVVDSGGGTDTGTGAQDGGTSFCATTGKDDLFCADFDRSNDVAAEWSPTFLMPDQTIATVELDQLASSPPRSARTQLAPWSGGAYGAQARLIKNIPPRSTTDKTIAIAADIYVKSTAGATGAVEIWRVHIEEPPGTLNGASASLNVQWNDGGTPLWYVGFTDIGGGASSAPSPVLPLDQWVKINIAITLGQTGAFTMRLAGVTAVETLNLNWSVSSTWQTTLIIGPAIAAPPTLGTIIYFDNVVLNTAP